MSPRRHGTLAAVVLAGSLLLGACSSAGVYDATPVPKPSASPAPSTSTAPAPAPPRVVTSPRRTA